uniref:Integrase, catalytic region, zinc finger, CCHC-type, peptidase aspartic, catalytic n=1 Tax=Tanacetum cinerariifolium TaxID=118510 RepID=A0A699HWH2_TANCI|nr:hypothetical protein [Tanacetum cinerariifolium]
MESMISLGQKNTLAQYMILSGADNHSLMLDKDLYDSWKSRMELYMQNREHRRMILKSVEYSPLIWPTIEENRVIKTKKYVELSVAEKIQADYDMKATNIILQGLPSGIYSLINHLRVAKDLWDRIQLLIQGTSLTKQERECKLYDAFDKFAHIKGESLHQYYLRFTQLTNDMNIYNMKLEQFHVNNKFLNRLPPEWSKFVTDFKLVKDLHTTNFDQLHAYLEQHELYANEGHGATSLGGQGQSYFGTGYKINATSSGGNNSSGQAKVLNVTTIKTIIPNNAAFQTGDLDTYDSDCDDISNAKAILIANISNYGSDVISEETLILKEESRSRMSEKENDPEAIKQNISYKPIDYEKINRLTKDFGKRFTPQQELSAKQALWLRMFDPTSKLYDALPIKIEAPKELPKIRLVNESLKKLKIYLAKFDNVVKIRTTPNVRTECEWRDLLNEIMKVQTVFDQIDVAVTVFN